MRDTTGIPERIETLEAIVDRIKGRKDVVYGIMPILPLSHYCAEADEAGVLFRYMFPLDGRVLKAYLFAEQFPDSVERCTVNFSMLYQGQHFGHDIELRKGYPLFLDLNHDIKAPTRLIVANKLPVGVAKLWLGFSFEVHVKHSKQLGLDNFTPSPDELS